MIKAILSDLSYVLLFPNDVTYTGELNQLHAKLDGRDGYNFSNYFHIDEELWKYYENLKKSVGMFMFTSGTIQNSPSINTRILKLFDKVYSAQDMGYSKKDPKVYNLIAKKLHLNPSEILFVDDTEANTKAADQAGMQIIKYTDINSLRTYIESSLGKVI